MTCSTPIDDPTNIHCKYDVVCTKAITKHCHGCGEMYCKKHYFKHQKELEQHLTDLMHTQNVLSEKWKSFISELSADDVLHLMQQVYEFNVKSDEIAHTIMRMQRQLQELIDEEQDLTEPPSPRTNGFESNLCNYLENDMKRLMQDIEELQFKLEEMTNKNERRVSEEQSQLANRSDSSENQSETTESLSINEKARKRLSSARLLISNLKNGLTRDDEGTPTLSHLLFRQKSPSCLNYKENHFSPIEAENETHPEQEEDDEDEMVVFVDSNSPLKINHKVRFSNNIVRYLRGPFKSMVHGTMHAVDVFAQGTHISEDALLAVKKGLARQSEIATDQQTIGASIPPTFVEITSDWEFEGENPERGFSSPSIWMRNPQGRRILVKLQEHPLCAANEWLAFALGRLLGLPVNEVQIAIYENNLATLHADVACEGEKTITFMDLPRRRRKALMTDPIMERMDIFDRIIQNVDRNQQNMLITMPKTADINDDTVKFKIHLIDHSNCFGMGKLNGISLIAAKFHSNHLAVVKFDPIQKSKEFERYLNKLPVADRPLISKTLNRFATITNEQLESWVREIQDLLSVSQYNRIHAVLYRQRDIAKRYLSQWGISFRSSSVKSNDTIEQISLRSASVKSNEPMEQISLRSSSVKSNEPMEQISTEDDLITVL